MSVVIETTLGDITVDLFLSQRPRACLNFLKLCKMKYYNFNLFHTISRGFIAQTGDPTGSRSGGESIFGLLEGPSKRFFEGENEPRIKHTNMGLISFVGNEERMIGSQFFITLGEDLTYLDEKHCVFGEVVEGHDILEVINEAICDTDDRPYQDIRITHTVILDDPYPDPKMLRAPSRSPSPSTERLQGGRIAPDENVDETEGKNIHEIAEMQAEREAKARATILEMVGDLPAAEMAPPENVLFVCKLNPVTTDDDLEIIFNRFGKIKSCEIIRDRKTNDSLQYAFIEFEDEKSCEDAYFKMDNVLIDDRRIHVDFSQSVSKLKWHGKGRGVTHYDHKGRKTNGNDNEFGKGNYKISSNRTNDSSKNNSRSSDYPKKNSERNRREKSYSKSPSRARDTPERSKRQPALKRNRRDNSRMDHLQPRSVKRVSRSHSRSPRRQCINSCSPSGRNDRRGSTRRREEHRSSTFGRDQAKHIQNEVYSGTRDRSRSPADIRTSSHNNRSRSDKITSRSSHNEAYSKSDRYSRNETNQSRKDKYPKGEKQSTEESRERSHRKIKEDIAKSETESKTKKITLKTIQSKSETRNVKKNKHSKSSESENGKNNKKAHKRQRNSDKDSNKRRKKKSKESSESSTSSSSSDSSSSSSSSDSSDSSSESDSSDSEIEKKKRMKTKKRTASTSSDSDNDPSRSKSRKKKKTVHSSDSSRQTSKKTKR